MKIEDSNVQKTIFKFRKLIVISRKICYNTTVYLWGKGDYILSPFFTLEYGLSL